MKKYLLPGIALILLVAAVIIFAVVPKNAALQGSSVGDGYALRDDNGDVLISVSDLSEDTISFIRLSEDSKVELIAIKGRDGTVKAALGTCQSCNGSPGAYYTQDGDALQCNNCGLTFPLSVIGEDGSGCHPIMIAESQITSTDDGIVISSEWLEAQAGLFASVQAH